MITEFNFTEVKGGTICDAWLRFYCDDFPVDLQKGDEIWIGDFVDLLKKGSRYCEPNIGIYIQCGTSPLAMMTDVKGLNIQLI